MLLGVADIAERLGIPELDAAKLELQLPPAAVVYVIEMDLRTPLWAEEDIARKFGDGPE